MTKRTIPELRHAIRTIAAELPDTQAETAAALFSIADELTRRSPARPRAPVKHKPLTEKQKVAIREFAWTSAGRKMHIADIAKRFDTNPGRVSEAIHGE